MTLYAMVAFIDYLYCFRSRIKTPNTVKLPVTTLTVERNTHGALMAEWSKQASQWHEMYRHDLEVMNSNPSRVELGVRCVVLLSQVVLEPKLYISMTPDNKTFQHFNKTFLYRCPDCPSWSAPAILTGSVSWAIWTGIKTTWRSRHCGVMYF